jgi:CheY-like chemotaxis protein
MPQPGEITVETANVDVPRPASPLSARDAFVALSVTDTGTGMSKETADRLFEPLFTTRAPGRGTGLGLSIVHSIVTDLGGSIHVESEPGKGARFTVCLPRAGAEFATPSAADASLRESSEPVTVLLADDQEGVRSLLRTYLTASGYRVLEAEDGEQAIRLASEYRGTIDLLITDMSMPKASGFDVSRAVSAQRAGIGTVFVSGCPQELIDGDEKLPAGARFLPKPFVRSDLLKAVSEALAMVGSRSVRTAGWAQSA